MLCAEAIPVEANRPSMIAKQEKMVTKVTLRLLVNRIYFSHFHIIGL